MKQNKILLLAIIASLLFSCSLNVDENEETNAISSEKVTISFASKVNMSRTVNCVEPSIYKYELYGAKSGETQTKLTTVTSLSSITLVLDVTTWDFTLYAYNSSGNLVLQGEQNSVAVTQGSTVNFTLCPIKDGEGSIDVMLYWPYENSTVASVVTTYNGTKISTLTSFNSGSCTGVDYYCYYVEYSATSVTSGDGKLVFQLYDSNSKLISTVMECVRVRKNLTSQKDICLSSKEMNSVPTKPASFSASYSGSITSNESDDVNLTWTDSSNTETSFKIEYCDYTTDSSTWNVLSSEIAAGSTDYTHTGALRGHTYNYRVYAVNTFGSSSYTSCSCTIPNLLILDANGGTGTMEKIPFVSDVTLTLPVCTFTSPSTEFLTCAGWSTEVITPAQGLSATYSDGGSYSFSSTGSLTLYAVWSIYYATSVRLSDSSVKMRYDETWPLSASISPTNTTDKTLKWTSTNESVATVDSNGVVTAVATGTAKITALNDVSGQSSSCDFTIDSFEFQRQLKTKDYSSSYNYNSIVISDDASFIVASHDGYSTGYVLIGEKGNDSWTWTKVNTNAYEKLAMSGDGNLIAGYVYGGYIYISTDRGKTWTEVTSKGAHSWTDIAISHDGGMIAACYSSGYIITSEDNGTTWTTRNDTEAKSWYCIDVSNKIGDYYTVVAGIYNGYIYKSTDSGSTWTEMTDYGTGYWSSILISADGTKINYKLGPSNGDYYLDGSINSKVMTHYNSSYNYIYCSFNFSSSCQRLSRKASVNDLTISGDGSLAAYVDSDYIYLWPIEDSSAYLDGGADSLDDINFAILGSTQQTLGTNATFTARADTSFTVANWYLDNVALDSTSTTLIIPMIESGAHTISAKVLANGNTFSDSFRFTTGTDFAMVYVESDSLDDFYISRYEVTQGEYEDVIGSNPSNFTSSGDYARRMRPVEQVSWYDAIVYCNKRSINENLVPCYSIGGSTDPSDWGTVPTAEDSTWDSVVCNFSVNGYRLPTSAERYWAAIGGNSSNGYTYSGSNTYSDVAWCSDNSSSKTHQVGLKTANELGIYDMSGNVWEWCWNWSSRGSAKRVRGGSWSDYNSEVSYTDKYYAPYSKNTYSGFRVVRTDKISPPSKVEISETTDTSVTLTWTSVSNADSYNVYYNTTKAKKSASSTVQTSATGTSITITGLSSSLENIYFWVTSVVGGKQSAHYAFTYKYTWLNSTKIDATGSGLDGSFYIGKYEVTQKQYKDVMGTNSSDFDSGVTEGEVQDLRPVENVSWYDAIVFCNTLSIKEKLEPCYTISGSTVPSDWGTVPTLSDSTWNSATCNFNANGYRLPTSDEWHWAAHGGVSTNNYTYSGGSDIGSVSWYSGNSSSKTHQVGLKSNNEIGLYDMSGNVAEWCWNWSSSSKIKRGGSYYDSDWYSQVSSSASAYISSDNIYSNYSYNGFRLVCSDKVSAPSSVEVSAQTSTSATLSWSETLGVDSYNVYYSTSIDRDTATLASTVTATTSTTATYTVTGLSSSADFVYFWVYGVSNSTESERYVQTYIKKDLESYMVKVTGDTSSSMADFYISKYEMMQCQYNEIIGSNPSGFTSGASFEEFQDLRPVEQVSWYDVIVFCNTLSIKEGYTPCYTIDGETSPTEWGTTPTASVTLWNDVTCNTSANGYKLPTSAEWYWAANGGASSGGYTYSGSNTIGDVSWCSDNASSKTHQVGQKKANELGLYDMSGNIREWCFDWYSSGSTRINRGGYYSDTSNISSSSYDYPYACNKYNGFRLVRTVVSE